MLQRLRFCSTFRMLPRIALIAARGTRNASSLAVTVPRGCIRRQGRYGRFTHQQHFSSVAPGAKRRFSPKRVAGLAFVSVYGILSLIPIGFSGASAYHYIKGNRKRCRGFAFYAWMGYLSLPLSVILLAGAPAALIMDGHTYRWGNYIQTMWATLTAAPFFTAKVQNAPKVNSGPAIYVSNHQSWLDVFVLLPMDLGIKFVSKREIFWIPLVGWVMHIIGHVPLVRGDRSSGSAAMATCQRILDAGYPVFFFAEGTRTRHLDEHGRPIVQGFKRGAFKLGCDNPDVPIVPISISGTREMLPPNQETRLSADEGKIKVLVHPALYGRDYDCHMDALRNETRSVIIEGLEILHC